MKNLIGIGNAGIDVTASVASDDELSSLGFHDKGGCAFPDYEGALRLSKELKNPLNEPGGVAANVLCTYGALGGQGRFIGKTAPDAMGDLFRASLKPFGVAFDTKPCGDDVLSTLIFTAITPDNERSFASYYGASHLISPDDVEDTWFNGDTTLLIDSYMLMSDGGPKTLRHAANIAKNRGSAIIFMPCSLSVIHQKWDDMQDLQALSNAIIANQEEALALAQKDTVEQTVEHLKEQFDWGVVTMSERGAIYFEKGRPNIHQPAPSQTFTIVNTNGAGDNFTGGFIYGRHHGFTIEQSLRLGQLCAVNALQNSGARPTGSLKHLLGEADE